MPGPQASPLGSELLTPRGAQERTEKIFWEGFRRWLSSWGCSSVHPSSPTDTPTQRTPFAAPLPTPAAKIHLRLFVPTPSKNKKSWLKECKVTHHNYSTSTSSFFFACLEFLTLYFFYLHFSRLGFDISPEFQIVNKLNAYWMAFLILISAKLSPSIGHCLHKHRMFHNVILLFTTASRIDWNFICKKRLADSTGVPLNEGKL